LTDSKTKMNFLVSVDGLSRHENDLLMGKGMSDETTHYLFECYIDVVGEKPYPPHSITLQEVDIIVRKWMSE
jgi:hypothetical protein